MYIRQQCLLSFEEIIKYQPNTKLEMILAQLDFTNILNFLHFKRYARPERAELFDPVIFINCNSIRAN